MNMQAILKQAQNMQKDMLKIKEEIDNTVFVGENNSVKVEVLGTKVVKSVKIDFNSEIEVDEIEMLEDMIMLAINSAMKQIDEVTEKKMGKFSNIPGLF